MKIFLVWLFGLLAAGSFTLILFMIAVGTCFDNYSVWEELLASMKTAEFYFMMLIPTVLALLSYLCAATLK